MKVRKVKRTLMVTPWTVTYWMKREGEQWKFVARKWVVMGRVVK